MPFADEMTELVDAPSERMDVEYKAWLDLSDHEVRAKLARHISGLSNFGGGAIVLGIGDDGASCGHPPHGFAITHDLVGAITQKYLDPAVHCDVHWVRAATGVSHPVIKVPPHGPTPICAKANGPDKNGKPIGIASGTYYLRKPGPRTEAITSPAEWRDVIRRCALHDRTAILAALSAALSPATLAQPSNNQLAKWASATDAAFLAAVGDEAYAVPLRDCRIQLSYRIETEEPETLPTNGFIDTLRVVGNDVDRHVVSGWSLFHVFSATGLEPYWASDSALGFDDFVEANLVSTKRTLGFDFWRVSPSGLASVVREFWEDTPDFGAGIQTTLNPKPLMRVLGELVRHAEAFASRFDRPVRVEFQCQWQGLSGRQLHSPNGIPFFTGPARTNAVSTSGTWAAAELGERVPEIVAALGGRVARALNWEGLTAERVASEESGWTQF